MNMFIFRAFPNKNNEKNEKNNNKKTPTDPFCSKHNYIFCLICYQIFVCGLGIHTKWECERGKQAKVEKGRRRERWKPVLGGRKNEKKAV